MRVRAPVGGGGVSLTARYSDLAVIAKLRIQYLKNTTGPKINESGLLWWGLQVPQGLDSVRGEGLRVWAEFDTQVHKSWRASTAEQVV